MSDQTDANIGAGIEDKGEQKFQRLLRVFLANSVINTDLYVSHFVIAKILTFQDMELIESKITTRDKQLQLAKCLAAQDDSTLEKMEKFALKNGHKDFFNSLVREGFVSSSLLNATTTTSQNAATSAIQQEMGETMSTDEKQRRLFSVFHHNETVDPKLYVSDLVFAGILNFAESEHINSKVIYSEKQREMAHLLSSRSVDVLKKLKEVARSKKHVDLARSLETAGF